MPGVIDSICVVLVRTQGPVNLGMIARLCGNLGVTDVRLVTPVCEVNVADTRKFATHSRDLVLNAPIFPDVASAVADCGLVIGSSARNRDEEYGASLNLKQVPLLVSQRRPTRYALVFGNEADGLTDAELRCCQAWVHLDTFGPNTSYNLSHAVGIMLYTLATSDQPVADALPATEPPAPREMIDRLYAYWLESLERFQYFRRTERQRFAPQLQHLFNRLDLSAHDVNVLWGMLAQFNQFTFGDRHVPERSAATDPMTATAPVVSEPHTSADAG